MASDLGLHCLHRHACPNTLGYYGTLFVQATSLNIKCKCGIICFYFSVVKGMGVNSVKQTPIMMAGLTMLSPVLTGDVQRFVKL